MMENWKVAKNCKSLTTEDGIELTYCEFGEENEEVVISFAFYHHTWLPVEEMLGKKYHVYGVVQRFGDGEGTVFEEDGTINWSKQWGDDLYKFAKALGIESFHYIGKCHGSTPGWYMMKYHPEMLKSFCSFYLAPHTTEKNGNEWDTNDPTIIAKAMRKLQTGMEKKKAELASLSQGPAEYGKTPPAFDYILGHGLWESKEECKAFLENNSKPVCYMFGTDDLLFRDWKDSNMAAVFGTKRARTIFLQGERHLMELDCPQRIAREAEFFFEDSKNNDYFD